LTLIGRLLRQPQRVWVRRAAFQIHLWTGIALGLYVVMLSITGSVLVYRNELDRSLATKRPVFIPGQAPLPKERFEESAARLYPGWTVTRVGQRISRRNPTLEIWLEKDGVKKERLFNPYTAEDLGDSVTQGELGVMWLARLHDELLFDRPGKTWNGVGSLVFTLSVLTGLFVWWPGIDRWRRSLWVGFRSGWKRINWDLHSAMGFWLFLFMLVWGVSGVYLGIPEPFANFVDAVSDPKIEYGSRWGDIFFFWLVKFHFGRWRSGPLKALWALVGLVPAVMFVTGTIMWWQRVVKPRLRRREQVVAEVQSAGAEAPAHDY
jgi:uncharacterized iron-regulated membrane protein